MHIFVFALMIALLPLRGWAGEVMATEMASSQLTHAQKQTGHTTELGAFSARIHWSKVSFNGQKEVFLSQNQPVTSEALTTSVMPTCEGHSETDATLTANTETDAQADSHCSTCPACQACHTVALSFGPVSLSATLLPRTLPHPAANHFASATAALGQKPPIS